MPHDKPPWPPEPDPADGGESQDAPLPEDATELAKIVQDGSQPQPRRDAAWSRLQEQSVRPMAESIWGNWKGSTEDAEGQDAFCAEAMLHVWNRLAECKKFDSTKARSTPG